MRDEFDRLCSLYPKDPGHRDPAFAQNPLVELIERSLPKAVFTAVPSLANRYEISASAGTGSWTHTPWLAVIDPAVTDSVQEGIYVVYLLSRGGERLYLSLNQGCTRLKSGTGGIRAARLELARRSTMMWDRIKGSAQRLRPTDLNLNVNPTVWRGKLYEIGSVAGVEYDSANLPSEESMGADLIEAIRLYRAIVSAGGWASEDEIERDAEDDGIHQPFVHAKRYRYHRSIERQPTHARRVRKILGTTCMGCQLAMEQIYGDGASGMIDVHHLIPLSSIEDGTEVTFDPAKDFAVLCPNCHRMIHRLPDSSDLISLRHTLTTGVLAKIPEQ